MYNHLLKVVWMAKTNNPGKPWANITTADQAEEAAAQAWIILQGQPESPAPMLAMYRAVCQALQQLYREEARHTARRTYQEQERSTPSPEAYTATAAALMDAARSETDKAILTALVAGYSLREIAAALDVSKSTVQRHAAQIRERYLMQD